MSKELSLRKQEINELNACKNVQDVLNESFKIFGNPILVHNMEYQLLVYVQNVECDDPIWNEYITMGTVPNARLDFFKEESFIDAAANTSTITFMKTEKLRYDRIFGKVYNNEKIQIACACIVSCIKPFEPDDSELFEIFCKILSKKMSEDNFFEEYGHEYQKRLISTLIESKYEDKVLYSPHVANIYDGLGAKIFIMTVDISKSTLDFKNLYDCINYFKKIKDYKYFEYDNNIVVILSFPKAKINIEKDLPEFNELFLHNNIYAGISSSFDNLYMLNKYYTEAKKVLEKGKNSGKEKRIFLF